MAHQYPDRGQVLQWHPENFINELLWNTAGHGGKFTGELKG
jgi:hypothetical protein